ncbi:hypothetical protein F383_29347 [Gossypium arboreum]|uniref:Uncharacterized protein n=1 Tax=Gossypium arboreum TaxID=29729 RepID=A0A0B0MW13_GOSAR|nr:hypothetical protein F383_29347 [Gossypium arboreum]
MGYKVLVVMISYGLCESKEEGGSCIGCGQG